MLLGSVGHAETDNLSTIMRNSSQIAASSAESSANITAVVSAPESEFSNLPHFLIADRPQRVRFFLSGNQDNTTLVIEGEGRQKLATDSALYTNHLYSFFGLGNSSANIGATTHPMIVKNGIPGMVAQPALLICYSDLLKRVSDAAKDSRVVQSFKNFRIDEVNLYLKPVVNEKLLSRAEADAVIASYQKIVEQIPLAEKDLSTSQARFREITRWLSNIDSQQSREKPAEYETIKAEAEALKTRIEQTDAHLTKMRTDRRTIENTGRLRLANRVISPKDTVLEISRVTTQKLDPALNIQIPFVTNSYLLNQQCVLPSAKDIADAITKLDRQLTGETKGSEGSSSDGEAPTAPVPNGRPTPAQKK